MDKLKSFEKTTYDLLGQDFTVYRKGEDPTKSTKEALESLIRFFNERLR